MMKLNVTWIEKIEKRTRFIISTVVLTLLLLVSTFFFFDRAWLFIPIFIVAAYVCTYFSIYEGISHIEWFTLFLMPILVTISFYFFYFLFPTRWITRIPFIIFYSISVYAMFLVSNIFNVGVEKSLQLYRAAFSVNYFYQSLMVFLFASLILSLKLNFFLGGLLFFVLGTVMATHLFWSIKLEMHWERHVVCLGLLVGFILFQVGILASFIPLQSSIMALLLSSVYYSVGGLVYLHLDERLFKETVREYLFVLIFVLGIVILTINW